MQSFMDTACLSAYFSAEGYFKHFYFVCTRFLSLQTIRMIFKVHIVRILLIIQLQKVHGLMTV